MTRLIWFKRNMNMLKEIPQIRCIVRLNFEKDGKRAERMPDWVKKKAWLWNTYDYSQMTIRYNYYRPTTGFVSIYWLLLKMQKENFTHEQENSHQKIL